MKTKSKSKCPECKGTGKHKGFYRCTECDGDGKAHQFTMMFWRYDLFPFLSWGRGFMKPDGTCYCPSYCAHFVPLRSMPLKEGVELADKLESLKDERRTVMEKVSESYMTVLYKLAPWVKRKEKP